MVELVDGEEGRSAADGDDDERVGGGITVSDALVAAASCGSKEEEGERSWSAEDVTRLGRLAKRESEREVKNGTSTHRS